MRIIKSMHFALVQGTEEELAFVKSKLKYKDPSACYSSAYKRGYWDGVKKLYKESKDGKTLDIPSGLSEWLKEVCEKEDIPVKLLDTVPEVEVTDEDMAGTRDYQLEAINSVLKKGMGIISVPTGGGKSYICLGAMRRLKGNKFLVIVHREELVRQLVSLFEEVFIEDTGVITAEKKQYDKKVVVAMIQTIHAGIRKKNKELLQYLAELDVAIVDEAHHGASKMYRETLYKCTSLTAKIGLTGTPGDAGTMEGLQLQGVLGSVTYEIPYEFLVKRGYIVQPIIHMYYGHWSADFAQEHEKFDFKKPKNRTAYWAHIEKMALITNQVRNKRIADMSKDKQGCLIIVNKIQHGKLLSEMTGAPFISGQSQERAKHLEDFKEGRLPCLISSPILDEGVDIHGILHVILAGGGVAPNKLLQRIGRGVRKMDGKNHVDIYDFVDVDVRKLVDHAKRRMKVYKAKKFIINKVREDK